MSFSISKVKFQDGLDVCGQSEGNHVNNILQGKVKLRGKDHHEKGQFVVGCCKGMDRPEWDVGETREPSAWRKRVSHLLQRLNIQDNKIQENITLHVFFLAQIWSMNLPLLANQGGSISCASVIRDASRTAERSERTSRPFLTWFATLRESPPSVTRATANPDTTTESLNSYECETSSRTSLKVLSVLCYCGAGWCLTTSPLAASGRSGTSVAMCHVISVPTCSEMWSGT